MLRAVCPWGDVGAQVKNARRAADLEGPGSSWRPVVCWTVAMGLYFRGEFGEADRWFAESAAQAPKSGQWLAGASSLAYRSLIAGERGRLEEQRLLAERAMEVVRERGTEMANGAVPVALGVSLAARGNPEEAQPLIERGIAFMLPSRGEPTQVANALLHHASVLQTLGEGERSKAVIAEARSIIDSCSDPGSSPSASAAFPPGATHATRASRASPRRNSGSCTSWLPTTRSPRSPRNCTSAVRPSRRTSPRSIRSWVSAPELMPSPRSDRIDPRQPRRPAPPVPDLAPRRACCSPRPTPRHECRAGSVYPSRRSANVADDCDGVSSNNPEWAQGWLAEHEK
jgi:hypothetical protein